MSPETFLVGYEAMLNKHDANLLDEFVHRDAVFIFTDGTFKGLDAIKVACTKTWAYFQNEVYKIHDVVWLHKDGISACCHYTIEWSADLDGERKYFSGRGTTVVVHTEGRWKIMHEHLSRAPQTS